MTRVVDAAAIRAVLPRVDAIGEIEAGFVAYSAGLVEVPPVGELLFPDAKGELHIKYGTIRGDSIAVVKVATGFFGNPDLGLPSFGGLNLVFSSTTGVCETILLDGGLLTNVRTAAAGAVAARHLMPRDVPAIGVLGTGTQVRMQLAYLRGITPCRRVLLWGRDRGRAEAAATDLKALGFDATLADSPAAVASDARLIVTTTASETPLLRAVDIRPGTHITAMGSDTPEKTELDPAILRMAEAVVADSIPQCLVRGEIHHALASGAIGRDRIVELGSVLAGKAAGRRTAEGVTVVDLTGVAVQDIKIVKAVLAQLQQQV